MVIEATLDVKTSSQIASMINKYNRWRRHISTNEILNSGVRYFIVRHTRGDVIACAGLKTESATLSKIQHVCVLPQFRCAGLASRILGYIKDVCQTDIYMTIREDNISSLTMAGKNGFYFVNRTWSIDHWVYTVYYGRSWNGYT